jgi:DNA repair exonuclease SbcCD ATPase subunit
MSVSLYTSQVNRLNDDLARLRSKLADERKKLADANSKALKATEALSRATSTSQLGSKAREVERHQKAAAACEKKVADIEKQMATKQRNLTSAQANLDRAMRGQQKKDDREAEKRRRADLDHIKAMERARRTAASLPETFAARPMPPSSDLQGQRSFTDTYDVCLSFAGEQRDYVERIAAALKEARLKVFYDQDEDIAPKLWGRDLAEYLDYIYREGSRFCLMFISKDYAEKAWTRHERRSALARAIEEEAEYILPARFDDTELPGLRPTVGYVDLREVAPATLVEFVIKKLSE